MRAGVRAGLQGFQSTLYMTKRGRRGGERVLCGRRGRSGDCGRVGRERGQVLLPEGVVVGGPVDRCPLGVLLSSAVPGTADLRQPDSAGQSSGRAGAGTHLEETDDMDKVVGVQGEAMVDPRRLERARARVG